MQPNPSVPPNPPASTEMVPSAAETPMGSGLMPVDPMIKRGQAAFRVELPALLKTHYRLWVAYHGDRRLGFGHSSVKLLHEWLNRGIPNEELLVRCVQPDMPYDEEHDEYCWEIRNS
jgi:hypothetical protein